MEERIKLIGWDSDRVVHAVGQQWYVVVLRDYETSAFEVVASNQEEAETRAMKQYCQIADLSFEEDQDNIEIMFVYACGNRKPECVYSWD